MTALACPSCGRSDKTNHPLSPAVIEWECHSCGQPYEIRVVFLRRERPVPADFVERLQERMAEEGLSGTEVAQLVGVTGPYISTVLSGKRRVSPRVAGLLAEALELDHARKLNSSDPPLR